MFSLLLLFFYMRGELDRRHWEKISQSVRDLVGLHAAFFKWNTGISMGLLLLWRICQILGYGWTDRI